MSEDFPPELRGELLDDFYAECDELLTHIRESLVQLEGMAGDQPSAQAAVEALFRHIHSLKGICAIAGLRSAEELAHGMEDLLRALSKRAIPITPAQVDALLVAIQRLEQVANAGRTAQPPPQTADILEQVRRLIPDGDKAEEAAATPPAWEAPKSDPVKLARERGLLPYLASFSPSPGLDRRGINVNAIRERLKALGEILGATPSVRGKGSIVFEFVVGLGTAPKNLAAWKHDGVTFSAATEAGARPAPKGGEAATGAHGPAADHVESLSLTPSHMVRVDLSRLDDLMRITGEMVIHRSRLEGRIDQVRGDASALKETSLALARSLREMRKALTRVRMVPVGEIFSRMPFIARDLARNSDKKVRVKLEGQHTEVDKYLVERLKEPLLHLVRNAFAHGIEGAEERVAAGKPAEAIILLRARSEGESVVIQIRDDGRGIDSARIFRRAEELGMPAPPSPEAAALLKILCTPGFSTKDRADMAAGRGVGMDIVAGTVRELGGTLTLDTTVGAGTEFTLRLPLTLSIADAMIVSIGDETCAVPQAAVDEIIQVARGEQRAINQNFVIPYRGGVLPIVASRTMFGLPDSTAERLTVLVLNGERGATGLVVDHVRGQREIVVRPIVDPLVRVPGISGATELGDGRPMLILDPAAITRGVVRPPQQPLPTSSSPAPRVS